MIKSGGYCAYHDGVLFADCPYKPRTKKESEWLGEWLLAALEQVDKNLYAKAKADGKRYDKDSGRIVGY